MKLFNTRRCLTTRTLALPAAALALAPCLSGCSADGEGEIGQTAQEYNVLCDVDGLWSSANDLVSAIPGIGLTTKIIQAFSKIGQRYACKDSVVDMVEQMEAIAKKAVDDTLLDRLGDNVFALGLSIQGNGNPTADNLDSYATIAQQRESDALVLGFPALHLQSTLAATKYGLWVRKHEVSAAGDKDNALNQTLDGVTYSLEKFAEQEEDLEDFIKNNARAGVTPDKDGMVWSTPSLRAWARIGDGPVVYSKSFSCTNAARGYNNCSSARDNAEATHATLKAQAAQNLRDEILSSEYKSIKQKLQAALSGEQSYGRVLQHCNSSSNSVKTLESVGCVNVEATGASYLSLEPGTVAEVFSGTSCSGQSRLLTSSLNFCGNNFDIGGSSAMNDNVRSVRVLSPGAIIRKHCNSSSEPITMASGTSCVQVSSGASYLTLPSGAEATVYSNSDCTGQSAVLGASTNFCHANFQSGGSGSMNDNVRSIKVRYE